jgi:hypothetical protein
MKKSKAIYSLSVEDVQTVADEVLERRLTEKEVALVEKSVGDYIDWFQAIENAIHNAVRC